MGNDINSVWAKNGFTIKQYVYQYYLHFLIQCDYINQPVVVPCREPEFNCIHC